MAVRVIGTAVLRGLVVDNPSSVVIYGRTLETTEIRWLFNGMTSPTIDALPYVGGRKGVVEDTQIVGVVLGREYRIVVLASTVEGLLADLRIDLANRARIAQRTAERAAAATR